MKIIVQPLESEDISLDVNASDSIRNVQRQIQTAIGMDPDDQRLIFSGRQLEVDSTIGDYNIQNESTLYLIKRLRGGPPSLVSLYRNVTSPFARVKAGRALLECSDECSKLTPKELTTLKQEQEFVVHIKTLGGDTITLTTDDTIENVKAKASGAEGSPDQLHLILELKGEHPLSYYIVGETFAMVCGGCVLDSLTKKYEEAAPADKLKVAQGIRKTCVDLGCQNEKADEILSQHGLCPPGCVRLNVRPPHGDKNVIEVSNDNTIDAIKTKIGASEVALDIVAGRTLSSYNLPTGTMLKALRRTEGQWPPQLYTVSVEDESLE